MSLFPFPSLPPRRQRTPSRRAAANDNTRTYKSVANTVAKGYRGDLRAAAVSRASAIRKSQRAIKERPASAPRGVKAKKAAAAAEEN